jgi:hypothetical protein
MTHISCDSSVLAEQKIRELKKTLATRNESSVQILWLFPDGGEPVGDGDRGAALLCALQRLLHHLLALRVQGGRRLVQQQDRRVPIVYSSTVWHNK